MRGLPSRAKRILVVRLVGIHPVAGHGRSTPLPVAKCDPISVLRGFAANSAADLSSSLPGVARCLPASPPQIPHRGLIWFSIQIGNRAWNVLTERTSASPRIVSGNGRLDVFLAGTVCTGDSRFQPDNPVVSRMSGRCAGRSARAARTFSALACGRLLRSLVRRPKTACCDRSRGKAGMARAALNSMSRHQERQARGVRLQATAVPAPRGESSLPARETCPSFAPCGTRGAQWSACVGLTQYRRPQANTRSSRLCIRLGRATCVLAGQPIPPPDLTRNLDYVSISIG